MFSVELADGVILAPLEPWQADQFAAAVERARPHLQPWITFASRIVDVESARAHLQSYAEKQARDEGAMFGIWADGVLKGGTLFRSFDVAMGVAEVGVWLDPSLQGRGLIKAACTRMIDYAFSVRGLSRVEWWCASDNKRSRAAAARLGMRHEGTLRSSWVLDGRRIDSEVWAVLADDWPPAV